MARYGNPQPNLQKTFYTTTEFLFRKLLYD